jgi:hypothetical protein
MRAAQKKAGMLTITKGSLQPYTGPTKPASICPKAIPNPMPPPTSADTRFLFSDPNMSERREKIRGRAPPTLIPVRALVTSSCSYVVVKYVQKHAPSPSTIMRAKIAAQGEGEGKDGRRAGDC